MNQKVCTKCQKELPLSNFSNDSSSKDGLMSRCKICVREVKRAYYESNRESIKKKTNEYYHQNKDKIAVRTKASREKNKIERSLYDKKRYAIMGEKIRERRRQYYKDNRSIEIVKNRKNYLKNKERYYEKFKIWLSVNTERTKALKRAYRVRKYSAEGSHTTQQWIELVEKYNYCCLKCKKQFPIEKLTQDHVVPLSKGGSNYIENIQPLCRSCNTGKLDRIIDYR